MFTSDSQHPPRSRHAVYLGGICLTPVQVDILVSVDSLAFCRIMYNGVFTWVETRAKSELRVRLVPLNMLKLYSFSISSIVVFLNVKHMAFTPYWCVRACACVLVVRGCGGGGSKDVVPFKHIPWPRYRLQYHVCRPPAVVAGGAVVTNAFYSHNACWYMRALNNNGNERRR